jgi:hypothetical protein
MAELESYCKQLESFRASDEARERLVSVRFLSRVQGDNFGYAKGRLGYHRKVQGFVRRTCQSSK